MTYNNGTKANIKTNGRDNLTGQNQPKKNQPRKNHKSANISGIGRNPRGPGYIVNFMKNNERTTTVVQTRPGGNVVNGNSARPPLIIDGHPVVKIVPVGYATNKNAAQFRLLLKINGQNYMKSIKINTKKQKNENGFLQKIEQFYLPKVPPKVPKKRTISHLRPTINGYDVNHTKIDNVSNSKLLRLYLSLSKRNASGTNERENMINNVSYWKKKTVNGKKVKTALQFKVITPELGMSTHKGLLYALQLEDDKVMFLDSDLKKVTLNGKLIIQNV